MSDQRIELPYKIATLCYLFDEEGNVLLLHRRRPPNQDLYSPPGGKLEQAMGESPTSCAVREIKEEIGLELKPEDLHLTGIVSEAGFDDRMHWLMFLYEVKHPVKVERTTFDEGTLDWVKPEDIAGLPIPATDKEVIWPLFWRFRGEFFMAHIDCHKGKLDWHLEQPSSECNKM